VSLVHLFVDQALARLLVGISEPQLGATGHVARRGRLAAEELGAEDDDAGAAAQPPDRRSDCLLEVADPFLDPYAGFVQFLAPVFPQLLDSAQPRGFGFFGALARLELLILRGFDRDDQRADVFGNELLHGFLRKGG